MARERMVTRTVEEINATVLTVNTVTHETNVAGYTVPPQTPTEKICKVLGKLYADNPDYANICFVSVISVETTEKLYAMYEMDFIKHAFELPLRNQKEGE